MEGQNRTDRHFEKLYEQYVPKLYNAALYLLGDRRAAAGAAERAWLLAMSDCRSCDCRSFNADCTRRLLDCCGQLCREVSYQIDEVSPSLPMRALELLIPLAGLSYAERSLVVLSAVQGFTAEEISQILRTPRWVVDSRLRHAVGKLCFKKPQSVAVS